MSGTRAVAIGDLICGAGRPLLWIAGPCVIESHELTLATRELALKTYDHMTDLERQIGELVSAIRALIDRIPPENLR